MGEHIRLGELIGKEIWADYDTSYEVFSAGPLIGDDSSGYMVELQLRRLKPHPHVPDHFHFAVVEKGCSKEDTTVDLGFFFLHRPAEDE